VARRPQAACDEVGAGNEATGGAAWIPDPTTGAGAWEIGPVEALHLSPVQPNPIAGSGRILFESVPMPGAHKKTRGFRIPGPFASAILPAGD